MPSKPLTMAKLPSAEELAEHLYHEECEHVPEHGGHCDDCTCRHLFTHTREVLEAASLIVGDAMPTGMLKDRVEHIMSKLKEEV